MMVVYNNPKFLDTYKAQYALAAKSLAEFPDFDRAWTLAKIRTKKGKGKGKGKKRPRDGSGGGGGGDEAKANAARMRILGC